jgi:hypothetical protein
MMAGQSETFTACAAAAIASCIGIPSILLSLGYSYSDRASWVPFPGQGELYREYV